MNGRVDDSYPDILEKRSGLELWIFIIGIFVVSFIINWLDAVRHVTGIAVCGPFLAAVIAFFFQLYFNQRPLIELYSKSYPYRKLKPYGMISAFAIFEFILVWGLHSRQILFFGTDLFQITLVLCGAVVYYHLFVRMKISLRFLILSIFIPLISYGAALGLGSYLNILEFIIPSTKIGGIVFVNTLYWVLIIYFFRRYAKSPRSGVILCRGFSTRVRQLL